MVISLVGRSGKGGTLSGVTVSNSQSLGKSRSDQWALPLPPSICSRVMGASVPPSSSASTDDRKAMASGVPVWSSW
jgi:hypothetical protein